MNSKIRWYYIVAGLLCTAAYVAFQIKAAESIKPWNDEAMAASAAYDLSTQGNTGVHFFDDKNPLFPGISRHTYYIFPFQLCVLAVWYKIAGFSLLSTRLISIGWTLVILGALYSFLKLLTQDRAIALLAAVLTAVDYHMMTEAAFGRYDTLVAALGFSAYSLYIFLRSRNLKLALLLSNACVTMAGATHPNGLVYFFGLWFLILYFDRKSFGWKEFGISAVPYLIGASLWIPFILQDFPSFRQQLGMNSSGRIGILHPWMTLVREIQMRYIRAFGLGAHSAGHDSPLVKLKALSLLMYVIGVVGCFSLRKIRTDPRLKILLIIFSIHWIYMTFWENMKFSYYLVYLNPFYCALLAVLAVTLWRSVPAIVPRWAIAGSLAAIAAVQMGGIYLKIRLNDYGNSYQPAVVFVDHNASPSDLVAATCAFGFGYGFDRNFIDDPSLGYYNGRQPDWIVEEEIYDGWWQERQTVQPDAYAYFTRVLRNYHVMYDHAGYRVYRRNQLGNR